MTQRT